jgi:hypothetical protein
MIYYIIRIKYKLNFATLDLILLIKIVYILIL